MRQSAEAVVGSQFPIVLPANEHLGQTEEIQFFLDAWKCKKGFKTGREGDESFAIVKIKRSISIRVAGQQ
jgi:hypothetical protein